MARLNDVSDFCKINNLNYFLVRDTLLESIRHNGFVSWNDDKDILRIDTQKGEAYE